MNQEFPSDPIAEDGGNKSGGWILLIAHSPLLVIALLIVANTRENASIVALLDAFKTFSAVILSFLGGIRWGMSVHQRQPRTIVFFASLLPATIGWLCLFLPEPISVSALLITVCAIGAWDSLSLQMRNVEHWFIKSRIGTTFLSALAHITVLLVIL